MSVKVRLTDAESSTMSALMGWLMTCLYTSENCCGDLLKRQVESGESFGMADEQEAAGLKVAAKFSGDFLLGLLVEVDESIPAENHVFIGICAVRHVDEIEPAEPDATAEIWDDADAVRGAIL